MKKIIEEAKLKEKVFAKTPIEEIISVLHEVGLLWTEAGKYFKEASLKLPSEISFSKEMIEETLRLIPKLLHKEALLTRLNAELGDYRVLDSFHQGVRAFPLGSLLHVTAGNVFLGCIDSLLMGLLTKNISFLKLSSHNQVFPELFKRSIEEADPKKIISDKFYLLHWKGGDESIEKIFKKEMKAILAWGGEDMLLSYKKDLALGTKLLDFGPKISLQVISKNAYEKADPKEVALKIARDISLWDQQACASPQNLFFEEGIDIKTLMAEVATSLEAFPLKRGSLDSDENVEILKEEYRGLYSKSCEEGEMIRGEDYLLHFDKTEGLRPSPLNRSLIFKSFKNLDQLISQLRAFSFYLQSCSYLLSEDEKTTYLEELGLIGMRRFAPLGSIMEGKEGAPHDGRYVLRDLVSFVGDEKQENLQTFFEDIVNTHSYYKEKLKNKKPKLENFPLMTGTQLCELGLPETKEGYIFSSGGTSGKSKFAYYTNEEFDTVAKLLYKGFSSQGLKKGSKVANLFAAGNLWSSFLAIDKALCLSGVTQLPIGALAEVSSICHYLKLFKPEAIFGLPSLLIQYANFCEENKIELEIPHIFYAGEHFSLGGQEFLKKIWKTKKFSSAGYASVDAGPIGYQCAHCSYGEHHLYSDIHLELIDEEAVVTSLYRKAMPIIRYRTGDRVVLSKEKCLCGSDEAKFTLLGRVDGQVNIWSSRFLIADIEKSFSLLQLQVPLYQIKLTSSPPHEFFELILEDVLLDSKREELLKKTIYENAKDLKATHCYEDFSKWFKIKVTPKNTLERVPRTGKIRLVIDER